MKINTYKPKGRDKWIVHLHGKDVPTDSHQIRRGGYATEREAQRAGRELVRQIEQGEYVAPSSDTVGDFLAVWLDTITPTLKPSTAASYSDMIRVYLKPRIGHHRLQSLAPEHVAKMYAELLRNGRKDGRGGLGAKTVRNVAGLLHKALKDGVKWGRVSRNVADAVDLPRWSRPEMATWDAATMKRFLVGTASTRFHACWRIALSTGCRRGELAALRWRHIDFEARTVRIVTARVKAGATTVEGDPKSVRSRRVLALDTKTIETLKAWKRQQSAERIAAGEGWAGAGDRSEDFVMANEVGKPLAPNTITRWWNREVIRLKLPMIRLHDGRHSYATAAIHEAREDIKIVSERLGHSDIATTLRLYTHVTAKDDRRVAERVAGLLD